VAWDLAGAFRKKGEHESARLDDFAFRLRARTMRLLAEMLGLGPDPLVRAIAAKTDDALLADIAALRVDLDRDALNAAYLRARTEARRALVAERGDPSPHRLA